MKWLPLTWRGAIICGASAVYLGLNYGYNRLRSYEFFSSLYQIVPVGDHVLRQAAIVGMLLVGISIISVAVSYILIRAQLSHGIVWPEIQGECSEEWQETGFIVPSLRWMYGIHLSSNWLQPELREGEISYERQRKNGDFRGKEKIQPKQRGYSEGLIRRLQIRDLLWLSKLIMDHRTPESTVVFFLPPLRKPVEGFEKPLELVAGEEASVEGVAEGDRLDSRQYQPGDPMRHILWRIVAKTGGERLYVRIPEKVGEFQIAIFMFVESDDEENAGFVRYALEEDLFGKNWIFGTGMSSDHEIVRTPDEALKLLARSGTEKQKLLREIRDRSSLLEKNISNFSVFQEKARREQCALCLLIFPYTEEILQSLEGIEIRMPCQGYMTVPEGIVAQEQLSSTDLPIETIAIAGTEER